ncbi:MAG: ferrochelatase [Porphyromonas sp.]|nr:ferrochelatase [Porphyromonas sp.]
MGRDKAILLINTGSPLSPSVREVRGYLKTFLSDPRVINVPSWLRGLLVHGFIAPFRAPRSAKLYASIWQEEGAPLYLYTQQLAKRVEELSGLPTLVAMRYNVGSTQQALEEAQRLGVKELMVVPLFPHYAMSSFESAVAHVAASYKGKGFDYQIKTAVPYYNHPLFIQAWVEQIVEQVPAETELLLFSYHGIPLSQARPYKELPHQDYETQCHKTTQAVLQHPDIRALEIKAKQAYQSRLGPTKWLAPNTMEVLRSLPKEGYKRVAVVAPSFPCDGLETLWEIGVEGKREFLQSGGEELIAVSCPNASDTLARAIIDIAGHDAWVSDDLELWTAPDLLLR